MYILAKLSVNIFAGHAGIRTETLQIILKIFYDFISYHERYTCHIHIHQRKDGHNGNRADRVVPFLNI